MLVELNEILHAHVRDQIMQIIDIELWYVKHSLVPRLPYLFNEHEKRGGAWVAKSRELRQPYTSMVITTVL